MLTKKFKIEQKTCKSCVFSCVKSNNSSFYCFVWQLDFHNTNACKRHVFKNDSFYSQLPENKKLAFLEIDRSRHWSELSADSLRVLNRKINNVINKKKYE